MQCNLTSSFLLWFGDDYRLDPNSLRHVCQSPTFHLLYLRLGINFVEQHTDCFHLSLFQCRDLKDYLLMFCDFCEIWLENGDYGFKFLQLSCYIFCSASPAMYVVSLLLPWDPKIMLLKVLKISSKGFSISQRQRSQFQYFRISNGFKRFRRLPP